jgi:hypothetical protein
MGLIGGKGRIYLWMCNGQAIQATSSGLRPEQRARNEADQEVRAWQ